MNFISHFLLTCIDSRNWFFPLCPFFSLQLYLQVSDPWGVKRAGVCFRLMRHKCRVSVRLGSLGAPGTFTGGERADDREKAVTVSCSMPLVCVWIWLSLCFCSLYVVSVLSLFNYLLSHGPTLPPLCIQLSQPHLLIVSLYLALVELLCLIMRLSWLLSSFMKATKGWKP